MQSSLPVPSQATITVNIGIVQSQQVIYGILFLNPTLPDDNTNGGIILPPSAVEDGAYEFETILN